MEINAQTKSKDIWDLIRKIRTEQKLMEKQRHWLYES